MRIILPIFFFFFGSNMLFAQLKIDAGTKWVSDTDTYVTLDSLGLVYNTDADTINNIFQFTGAKDAYLTSNVVPNFKTLIVDKANNQLILNTDLNIYNKVRFKSGLLNLYNHTVALSPYAFLENENEASRFIDTNYGSVKISVNTTHPSALNPGNIGAVISSATYSGDITVFRGHHPQSINSPSYTNNSISRYYTIFLNYSPFDTVNATLRLYYFDAEKNGLDENKFVIWYPQEGEWENLGVSSRSTTLNYVEQKAINNFGTFAIAPSDLILAVSGLKLSGIWNNNASQLTWITSTEINNNHFDIERKYLQDNSFIKITAVASKHANGNAQTATTYNYTDASTKATASAILYRLKQVDKDGGSIYSNTIAITPSGSKQFIVNVYPTISTKGEIFIQSGNVDVGKMQVQIFDMSGRRLFSQSLPYQSQWLLLPSISGGMYKMIIQSGDYEYKCSFIK